MTSSRAFLVAGLAALLLAGCSAIPPGGDPGLDPALRREARDLPRLGRLAVAPVASVALASDEAAKGWRVGETPLLGAESLRSGLVRALEASQAWDGVRASEAASAAEAWTRRDDWVLSVELSSLRTHFDGRNGWWIPNMINFLLNTPFSWWVATEEYSLTFDANVALVNGDSGAIAGRAVIPVKASGTFDEFDRGWQVLGPIVSSLDAEGWRGIAEKLLPEARRSLAVSVALEAERLLRSARETSAFVEAQRKTLVLAVGITSYEDPRALPPLPFARGDARRVAGTFEELGALAQHVVTLVDSAATAAAVTSRVADHLGRAREGDDVVLWFSGYGTRTADGRPAILLYDSAPDAALPLDELARSLAALEGDKLLVVDAAFSGPGRSIGAPRAVNRPDADVLLLEPTGVSAVLAGRAGEGALAPDHLRSGLLTFHALRELERAGRESRRVVLRELFASVQARVSEDAELTGATQVPQLAERGQRFDFVLGRGGDR